MRLFKRRPATTEDEMTLQEAVARCLVTVDLLGYEEGEVARARLRITKKMVGPLRIHIPAGTDFVPDDGGGAGAPEEVA